jgi:P-type Cu+ transporter
MLRPPAAGDRVRCPAGAGVRGRVGDRLVTVGSLQLFAELSIEVPAGLRAAVDTAGDSGRTAVLLTGDNERTALTVASQLGIPADSVFAGVGPEGKAAVIRQLQSDGTRAALVGDGVNDAAALAQADLGMAIGTGTDVAIGAADLTLVSGYPDGIADAIQLSRATMTVIRANLTWAFGYNVIAIPVAALGYLNPLFAGIAMSASSLIVVANSLRMRRFTPQGRPQ